MSISCSFFFSWNPGSNAFDARSDNAPFVVLIIETRFVLWTFMCTGVVAIEIILGRCDAICGVELGAELWRAARWREKVCGTELYDGVGSDQKYEIRCCGGT